MLEVPKFPQFVRTSSRPTDVTPDRPVRVMSGRRANKILKEATTRDRALFAYEWARGRIEISPPTLAQAAALAQVSPSYVATVSRLTEDQRVRLARGELELSRLHNRQRDPDAEVDRCIKRHGVDLVWAGLDRATAPTNTAE